MFSFSNSGEDRCHDFYGRADIDKNGNVDWLDLYILTENWLSSL